MMKPLVYIPYNPRFDLFNFFFGGSSENDMSHHADLDSTRIKTFFFKKNATSALWTASVPSANVSFVYLGLKGEPTF